MQAVVRRGQPERRRSDRGDCRTRKQRNGEYVRFADGTQICWRRHLRAPGVMAGGAFVSLGAYTFPVAFVAPPVVAAMYDGGWSVYIMASVQGVTAAGLGGAYFTNVGSASRDTTGTNPTFHYITVGRWF